MEAMTRRVAARSMILSITAGLAAACVGRSEDELRPDVALIVNGLNAVIPILQGLPANVQPSTEVMAKIQEALDALRGAAAQIGTALTPNADAIQKVSEIVGALATVLAPFYAAAPTIGVILQSALALLPGLLRLIGKAPAAAAKAASVKMPAPQARKWLGAAAAME